MSPTKENISALSWALFVVLCVIGSTACADDLRPQAVDSQTWRGFFGVPEYGTELLYRIDDATSAQEVKAVQVIERRLRHFGLRDTEVRAVGKDQILLKCPHGDNIRAIRDLLAVQGSFKIVLVATKESVFLKDVEVPGGLTLETETMNDAHMNPVAGYYFEGADRKVLETAIKALPLPPNTRMTVGKSSREGAWRTWLLSTEHHIDEPKTEASDARVERDFPMPQIRVELGEHDAHRFADLTKLAVKRRLALEMDGEVLTAPIVQEPITEGHLIVSLGMRGSNLREAMYEASIMASMIREGGIPKPVHLIEERKYGEHPE